ncbi:MAG: hypothetical protein ACK4SN_16235, partial [Bellilinea sp.]
MRKLWVATVFLILLGVGIFGTIRVVQGQVPTNGQGEQILLREELADTAREITAPQGERINDNQIHISFIDSPSATCYQPDPAQDVCYIKWYYLSVSASPSYMLNMDVKINEIGNVARVTGFFQTSMNIPFNMLGDGFKVSCGAAGVSGDPEWGKSYSYT